MVSDTDEAIDKLSDTLLERFHGTRERSFERGSKFIFENVDLLYYFHRIDMRRGGSYIEPSEWIKNKGSIINPKNIDDDYCLQYSVPAALDHKGIGKNPHRMSKIEPFIRKYNWEGTEFSAVPKEWIKSE